jgi:hypothetical protein
LPKFPNRPEQRIISTVVLAHDLDLDLDAPFQLAGEFRPPLGDVVRTLGQAFSKNVRNSIAQDRHG